jgi:hypothetical protein
MNCVLAFATLPETLSPWRVAGMASHLAARDFAPKQTRAALLFHPGIRPPGKPAGWQAAAGWRAGVGCAGDADQAPAPAAQGAAHAA